MKIILLFIFFSSFAFCQENNEKITKEQSDVDFAYICLEVKPEFKTGIKNFYKYVGDNYKLPNVNGLTGTILVTFVVEKDGSLTDIEVLKDLGYGTGEEAIRVLKACPKWNPGLQDGGKPVRVKYTFPIKI